MDIKMQTAANCKCVFRFADWKHCTV